MQIDIGILNWIRNHRGEQITQSRIQYGLIYVVYNEHLEICCI